MFSVGFCDASRGEHLIAVQVYFNGNDYTVSSPSLSTKEDVEKAARLYSQARALVREGHPREGFNVAMELVASYQNWGPGLAVAITAVNALRGAGEGNWDDMARLVSVVREEKESAGEVGDTQRMWTALRAQVYFSASELAGCPVDVVEEGVEAQKALVDLERKRGVEGMAMAEHIFRLACLYESLGRRAESVAANDNALVHFPKHPGALTNRANTLYRKGDAAGAMRVYAEVAEGDVATPAQRAVARSNLATIADQVGDFGVSMSIVAGLLDREPWLFRRLVELASAQRRSLEWEKLERSQAAVAAEATGITRWRLCSMAKGVDASHCAREFSAQIVRVHKDRFWAKESWGHGERVEVEKRLESKKGLEVTLEMAIVGVNAYNFALLGRVTPDLRATVISFSFAPTAENSIYPPARSSPRVEGRRRGRRRRGRLELVFMGADFRCHPMGHMTPAIFSAVNTSTARVSVAHYDRPYIPPTEIPTEGEGVEWAWELEEGAMVARRIGERVVEEVGDGGVGWMEVAAMTGLVPIPGEKVARMMPRALVSKLQMSLWMREYCNSSTSPTHELATPPTPSTPNIAPFSAQSKQAPISSTRQLSHYLDSLNPSLSTSWRAARCVERMVHVPNAVVDAFPAVENCPVGTFITGSGGLLPTRLPLMESKTLLNNGWSLHPWRTPPSCGRLSGEPAPIDLSRSHANASVDSYVFAYSDENVLDLFHEDFHAAIVVDFMGWTTKVRRRLVSGRAAPVNIAYLGWPGSTHTPLSDYIIADATLSIPERQFTHALYSPSGYHASSSSHTPWRNALFSWYTPTSELSLVPRCNSSHHIAPPAPIQAPQYPTLLIPHPYNFWSEGQILLPRTYQASRPPGGVPQLLWDDERRKSLRRDVGLPEDGIVLACIGRVARVGPDVVDAWAQALRARARRDRAVLWVMSCKKPYRERLLQQLAARGVGRHLVHFSEVQRRLVYITRMSAADVVLDSREYNGHSTMTEALWGGTVVVTLAGGEFPARVGASLLYAADRYPPHPSLLTSPPSSLASTALYRLSVHSSLRSYTTTASSIPLTALKAMRDRLARSAIGSPLQSADEGGAKHAYRGMLCSYEVMMVSGEDDVGVCGSEGGVGDVLAPGVMHESGGWSPWHVIVNPSERWDVDEAVVEHRSARGLTHALSGSMAFASGNLGAIDVQEGGDHDGVVSVWHASSSMSCADGVLEASMSSSDPWKVLGGGARSGCGRMSPQVQGSAVSFHLASGAVLHSELYGDEVVEALSRLVRGVSRIRMERAYRRRVTSAVSRTSLHHALVEMYGSEEAALNSREADEVGSTIRPQREDTESMYMVEGIPLLSRAWGIGGWGESDGHLSASASSSSSPSPPSYASSCICGGMASWCEGHGVRGNLSGLLLDDLFVSDGVLSGSEDCVSLMKEMLLERAVKCSVSMKEMVKSGQVLESWISSLRTTPLPSTLISISRSLPQPHTSTTQPHSIPTTSPHPTTPPSHTITSYSDSESLFLSTFNMSSSSPLRMVLSPLSWRLGLWEARGGMVKLDDLLKSQLSSIAASFRALVSESESTCTCVSHCASHPIPPPPTHFQTTSLPITRPRTSLPLSLRQKLSPFAIPSSTHAGFHLLEERASGMVPSIPMAPVTFGTLILRVMSFMNHEEGLWSRALVSRMHLEKVANLAGELPSSQLPPWRAPSEMLHSWGHRVRVDVLVDEADQSFFPGWSPWHRDSVGGSEEALIQTVQGLGRVVGRDGTPAFLVRVFTDSLRPEDWGKRDESGVGWFSIAQYWPEESVCGEGGVGEKKRVVIVYRLGAQRVLTPSVPSQASFTPSCNSTPTYVWLQDSLGVCRTVHVGWGEEEKRLTQHTRTLFVSLTQLSLGVMECEQSTPSPSSSLTHSMLPTVRGALSGEYGWAGVVRNTIPTDEHVKGVEEERVATSFVFASNPARGLLWLLRLWPKLRASLQSLPSPVPLPPPTLTVLYGVPKTLSHLNEQRFGKTKAKEWTVELESLLQRDGVVVIGRVPPANVSKLFTKTSFWLYPSVFAETSCLVAMRAMLAGAIPITTRSPHSAVYETTNSGAFDLGPSSPFPYSSQYQTPRPLDLLQRHKNASIPPLDTINRLYETERGIIRSSQWQNAYISAVVKAVGDEVGVNGLTKAEEVRALRRKMVEWAETHHLQEHGAANDLIDIFKADGIEI